MAALKGTCLVTGSTGRVGKEVIARLSKAEGFTVRAATRTGADYAKSLVRPLKAIFHYYSPSPRLFHPSSQKSVLFAKSGVIWNASDGAVSPAGPLLLSACAVEYSCWAILMILFYFILRVVLTNHQQGAHETVVFDLTDKSTWGPAMEGVTHLFSS